MRNSTKFDTNIVTHVFAIPIALFALFAYATSLYLIHKSQQYRNVFGVLCIAYVSFHIQTISALLVWTIVRIIAHLETVSFPWTIFIRIASPIANSALYAAIWMQFVLAINRLWAILYPITYHRIFNLRNARVTVSPVHSWSTLYGPCNHSFLAYIAILLSDDLRQYDHTRIFVSIFRIDGPFIARVTKVTYTWLAISTLDRYLEVVSFPWTIFIRIASPIANSALYAAIWMQFVWPQISPVHSWSTLYGPCNHPIFAYIATFLSDGIILISLIIDAVAFYCTITYLKTCVSTIIHAFFVSIFRIDGPFIARVTKVTYTWLAMSTLDSLVFVFFNRNLLMNRNAVGESAIQITSFQERQRDKRSILMK
ncbi:hypothetical protein DINM_006242 [Dirofilaria immitis]|nr:hypothetical protein [Dirofilaria immitis]